MTAQVSQLSVQCLVKISGTTAQASQLIVQALAKNGGTTAQVTQLILQALVKNGGTTAQVAQLLLNILVWNGSPVTYPVFPVTLGLGYSVIKRPVFYNSQAKSGSGWTTRVAYSATPTWEWDLTYERQEDYSSSSELKTVLGFYLAMQGSFKPFLYQDQDDNAVVGQALGTSDGTTTSWTFVRTYGYSQTETENVGYVNTGSTLNVYVGGTLQSPSTYSVVTTTPMSQLLTFNTAPATGYAITADFSYYFYVHFKEDTEEWEKFLYQLWSLKKITIESLKG
jgi:uncharacterized protein (TIGR02217 family)